MGLKEGIRKSGQGGKGREEEVWFFMSWHRNDGKWNYIKSLIAFDEKILDP